MHYLYTRVDSSAIVVLLRHIHRLLIYSAKSPKKTQKYIMSNTSSPSIDAPEITPQSAISADSTNLDHSESRSTIHSPTTSTRVDFNTEEGHLLVLKMRVRAIAKLIPLTRTISEQCFEILEHPYV